MSTIALLTAVSHPKAFYTVGFTGTIFSIDVITSDTSSLRNRGLAYAFTSSPYMITAFAGSPLSNQFHETNWRWAYGTICIILPIAATPLVVVWELAKRKADGQGRLQYKPRSTRTWIQSVWFYIIEFDGEYICFLRTYRKARTDTYLLFSHRHRPHGRRPDSLPDFLQHRRQY